MCVPLWVEWLTAQASCLGWNGQDEGAPKEHSWSWGGGGIVVINLAM